MPKREKTPSPGPDEPKFLSIFYPWPPHVTLEDLAESKNCARWLSCFIGKENLYAMFYKPSSPNTIIVEINHELTDEKMRGILGQHDWETVFPQYRPGEEGITRSRVFYSTFRTRREVEKTGWKIRVVTDEWFDKFNPKKGVMIKYPYPPTTFCEPPGLAEEVNALQLFRYLPGDIFPEARLRPTVTETVSAPPTAPPPRVVPGSGGRAGSTGGNVNAAGSKGKKKGADPNVRQTAPVTRSSEAGAKAKATHSQPVKIMANVYDEDSEGDDGYGNYALHHQDEEEEEEEEEKPKGDKPKEEDEDLNEGIQNVHIDENEGGYVPQFDPFIRARQEETSSADDICPNHKKKCKPGICQWAADKKRQEKQRQSRTGGRSGQNTRRW